MHFYEFFFAQMRKSTVLKEDFLYLLHEQLDFEMIMHGNFLHLFFTKLFQFCLSFKPHHKLENSIDKKNYTNFSFRNLIKFRGFWHSRPTYRMQTNQLLSCFCTTISLAVIFLRLHWPSHFWHIFNRRFKTGSFEFYCIFGLQPNPWSVFLCYPNRFKTWPSY